MQQFRGNLHGFDCDVICLPRVIVLFVLTLCTRQALVSDMTSNAAFAGVATFKLVIFNEEAHLLHTASSAFPPCALHAESKFSGSCAARVFSLLSKMPNIALLNCHRCAVATAGVWFLKVSRDFCFATQYIISRRCCFGRLLEP